MSFSSGRYDMSLACGPIFGIKPASIYFLGIDAHHPKYRATNQLGG